jgi:type I thyroxine 5'-deiodinase
LPVNIKDEVVFENPRSLEERSGAATACVRRLGLRIPALIDHLDDSTEEAYTGWPDRLYLIDRDGRVAYKSRPGPFGFKPAELEEALRGRR